MAMYLQQAFGCIEKPSLSQPLTRQSEKLLLVNKYRVSILSMTISLQCLPYHLH